MKILLSTICIISLALLAYQVMSFSQDLGKFQYSNEKNLKEDLSQSLKFELPKLVTLKDIDQYSEIIQRPLFTKNRTPARDIQTTQNIPVTSDLDNLVLVGTAKSTDVQIGIVANTKVKQIERLKTGQRYKDWKIAEIAKEYIIFQNEEIEYKLFITPIEQRRSNGYRRESKRVSAHNINQSKNSSYKNWERTTKSLNKGTTSTEKVAGGIDKYKKQSRQIKSQGSDKLKVTNRSPIKIPDDEEKDPEYYEALDEEENNLEAFDDEDLLEHELSDEEFYEDDEDISEEELKSLEALSVELFDY